MITEFKDFRLVSGGGSDIDYTISSNNSCVSVTPSQGTVASGSIVRVEFSFADEACFATNFTLSAKSKDCPDAEDVVFVIPVPCTSLQGTITNVPSGLNPFIFILALQGGNPGYQVQWQFNTALFETVNRPGENRLELNIKSSVTTLPATSEIRAFITDSKGCQETATYILTICSPQLSNSSVQTTCINTVTVNGFTASSAYGGLQLQASPCAGSTIDWSTLEMQYNTQRILPVQTGDQLTIYALGGSLHTSQEQIAIRVKDSNGVYSNHATIYVTIPPCTVDAQTDTQ